MLLMASKIGGKLKEMNNMLIKSNRLILRPFVISDKDKLIELCNDIDIFRFTENVPYPYTESDAIKFIETSNEKPIFAITMNDLLVGCIGLIIEKQHNRASLGFWIGKDYRKKGICVEAGKLLVNFGFNVLNLNRIFAGSVVPNVFSRNALSKMGFVEEGVFHSHFKKGEKYYDLVVFGIVRGAWLLDEKFLEAFL